jgi:D-ribose pyranase
MKKLPLLNQPISSVIAGMGHLDSLCIADAGLPIPPSTQRIDLAITKGIPTFLQVAEAVLGEMQVQVAIVAYELQERSPELHTALCTLLTGIPIEYVSHELFKEQTKTAKAVVRTGEFTPYANVILISGVVF